MKRHRLRHVVVSAVALAVLAAAHLAAAYHAWNVRWAIVAAVGMTAIVVKIGIAGWVRARRSKSTATDQARSDHEQPERHAPMTGD